LSRTDWLWPLSSPIWCAIFVLISQSGCTTRDFEVPRTITTGLYECQGTKHRVRQQMAPSPRSRAMSEQVRSTHIQCIDYACTRTCIHTTYVHTSSIHTYTHTHDFMLACVYACVHAMKYKTNRVRRGMLQCSANQYNTARHNAIQHSTI
jgi:hypothetical protein